MKYLNFRYVSIVENIFSTGIFFQFLASIVVICLTGFQMLVVSNKCLRRGVGKKSQTPLTKTLNTGM